MITNTKSKDYKSLVEVNSEKYNIKNTKQNKSHKHKNVYMKFAFKNRVFFLQGKMTVISTTVGRNPSEEMEWPSWSTKESERQYLDAVSKTTE